MSFFLDIENVNKNFAIFGNGKSLTGSELTAQTGAVLHWLLSQRLERGAIVGLDLGQPERSTAWLFACLRLGLTVMPLDPKAPAARMRRLIEHGRPTLVVGAADALRDWQTDGVNMAEMPDLQPSKKRGLGRILSRKSQLDQDAPNVLSDQPRALPDDLPPMPDDAEVGILIYTSGSSGAPKGVQLTFGNLTAHLNTLQRVYGMDAHSRILNNLALHHADGLIQGPLLAMHAGATWLRPVEQMSIASTEDFMSSPYLLRATHIYVVPFYLRMIQGLPHWHKTAFDYPECQMLISVSAALSREVWSEAERLFEVPVVNVYGLTETVAGSLFAGPDDASRQVGTVGRPVDCEAKIVDGELWLRGPHISPGYKDVDPAEGPWTAEGWFRTGDLARYDEASGCFTIEGRIKNACNVSGYLVRPEEITEALVNLPGIADAVCFGVADEHTEERIVAAVVTASGHPWAQLDAAGLQLEIAAALRHDLEAYKVPAAVQVWPSLPRGDSGKVPMPAVHAAWSEGLKAVQSADSAEQLTDLSAQIIACAKDALRNADVHAGSDSTNTIGWDSMAHLDLIQRIESRFRVQFTVSETMRANAISTLETILRDKLN